MKLAVYETKPVLSALELYWESSTAGLVSDLNYNIKNNTTEITGSTIEGAGGGFDEADISGTSITNTFFPTNIDGNIGGNLVVGTGSLTASITTNVADATVATTTNPATFITSGSGTGAVLSITTGALVGDGVTVVTVITSGSGYVVGDTLTITVPGASTDLVITLVADDISTNPTAQIISVNSKYEDGILNTSNRSSEFLLISNANGSYKINTASTFYAGENNATENFFEFTIQFKQANGLFVDQSYNTTLTNIDPLITLNTTPLAPSSGTDVEIFNSITPVLGTTYGPTGTNGSVNTSEYYLFPRQTGAGWTITELFIGATEIALASIGDYFTVTQQGKIEASTGYGLQVKSVPTYTLVAGTIFKFKFSLKDALGATTETGQITLPAVSV